MTRHFLGLTEVAAHAKLARDTIKAYARDGYLPEPDVTIGDIRGWSVASIDAWLAARPGRGARTDLAVSKGKK